MAGAFAYLSIVPIDLTPHLPRIKAMIEERVAGRVDAGRLVIKVLPSPEVRVEGLETTLDGKPILGVRSAHVKVSLLPLITGRVVLEEFDLEGANIFIDRTADGKVNVLEFLKATEEILKKKKRWFSFSVRYMDIADTQLEITDRLPDKPVKLEITGVKGLIKKTDRGLVMEARASLAPGTEFTFRGEETLEGMKGAGSLRALDLERFSPYAARGFKGGYMKGTVDFDFTYGGKKEKELNGALSYSSVAVSLPGLMEKPIESRAGSAAVTLWPEKEGLSLAFDDINLDLGAFAVYGKLKLDGPPDRKSVSLGLSTTPMPLAALRGLVPMKALPEKAATTTAAIKPLNGTLTIKNLSVSGPVDGLKGTGLLGSLSMDAALANAKFLYGEFNRPFEDVNASISLKDKTLAVTGMTVRYGKNAVETLALKLSGLTGKPSYGISMKARLDAAESLELASSFLKDRDGAISRALPKIIKAGGRITIDGDAAGRFDSGVAGAAFNGKVQIRDGAFEHKDSPLKLQSINASASFDRGNVTIEELRGSEGTSSFSVAGNVNNYMKPSRTFRLNARGEIDGGTLKRASGTRFGETADINGKISSVIDVAGSMDDFNADVVLDAKRASIRRDRIISKPAGKDLKLDIKAARKGAAFEIKNAHLSFGGESSVSVAGSMVSDMSRYDMAVSSKKIRFVDLGDVSPYFINSFDAGGDISLRFATAKESAPAPPSYNGEIDVRDGRFQTPLLAKPVEDIDASARFSGNEAKLVLDNLSVGRTRLTGRMDIPDIAKRKVAFELASPALYTSDIFLKKDGGKKEEKKPTWAKATPTGPDAPAATGRGTIRIAKGELFGQPFEGFSADINMNGTIAVARPVKVNIDRGRVAGGVTYYQKPSNPKLFDGSFTLSGLDINTMLTGFGAKKEYLTGTLNGEVNISGKRGVKPATAGLNGAASLRAEKGRMWKFPVLADIFSIVNVFSIDELFRKGLPYKTITGDFTIKDGVVSTEALAMESDSLRMSAVGDLDIPGTKIDIVVALHPFVTIDKIISKIPIAGWLITGKEKSTVSMYFGVRGALKDPSVRPMPIEGIGKGVLGILERLIETPGEILKKGEEAGKELEKGLGLENRMEKKK